MKTKTFSTVSSVALVLTLAVATFSVAGIVVTGLYPGMIVLWLLALIPVGSRLYAGKKNRESGGLRGNQYTLLAAANLLSVFIVLWMTFVIMIDRVIPNWP